MNDLFCRRLQEKAVSVSKSCALHLGTPKQTQFFKGKLLQKVLFVCFKLFALLYCTSRYTN